ncbi:MAG TPA: hypothetical protein VMZ04_07335, partial [Anaerolineae bacterium]|nr:hypothetical protein [Anaerolineae bacterium]
ETAGIKRVGRPKGPSFNPVQCPNCYTINVPGSQFCNRCGISFSDEGMAAVSIVRNLMSNPDDLIAYAEFKKARQKNV